MVSIIRRYPFHFLIAILGLLWFGLISHLLQLHLQTGVYFDSENYKDAAEMLYRQFRFHFYRPSIIAAFCGIPYLFGGLGSTIYTVGIYLNFTCWIGTSLMLFGILKSFLKERQAFIFTLCFYLMIGALLSVFHLLTESLYAFVMVTGFYFLSKHYRSGRFINLSVALSIFLLSMLIKPASQYLAVFFVLYYAKTLWLNYKKTAILFLAGTFILMGLQLFEMKKQYGNFTISYISGPTFYNYLGARAAALRENKTLKQVQEDRAPYIFSLDFPQQQQVAWSDLKSQLQYNAPNLVKAYCINLTENTKTPSDCLAVTRNVNKNPHFEFYKYCAEIITKWENRILTVSGFLLALYCLITSFKKSPFFGMVSIYILYVILLSGISCHQGDRFHLVFFPMVIILFAGMAQKSRFKNEAAL